MRTTNARAGIIGFIQSSSYLSGRRSLAGSMEKHLDSMVMVACGASRNVHGDNNILYTRFNNQIILIKLAVIMFYP